jgi:hypothetical protein
MWSLWEGGRRLTLDVIRVSQAVRPDSHVGPVVRVKVQASIPDRATRNDGAAIYMIWLGARLLRTPSEPAKPLPWSFLLTDSCRGEERRAQPGGHVPPVGECLECDHGVSDTDVLEEALARLE